MSERRLRTNSETNRQLMNSMSRTKKIYQFFAVIIATAFISSAITLTISADGPTGFGTVIEPGSMVGDFTYIVFKDGIVYYQKDGQSGEILASGTNATTIINDSLTDATGGGKVLLKAAEYELTWMVSVPSEVSLFGEGPMTVLSNSAFAEYPAGGVAGTLQVSGTSGAKKTDIRLSNFKIVVEDKKIDAIFTRFITDFAFDHLWIESTGTTVEEGLQIESGERGVVSDIQITGTGSSGNYQIDICEYLTGNYPSRDITLTNIVLTDACGGGGLMIRGSESITVNNIIVENADTWGIIIQNDAVAAVASTKDILISNFVVDTTTLYRGIQVKGSTQLGPVIGVSFLNGIVRDTNQAGIYLYQVRDVRIASTTIRDCGVEDTVTTSGIYIYGSTNIQLTNNNIINCSRPATPSNAANGVEAIFVTSMTVTGNLIEGAGREGVYLYGSRSIALTGNIIRNNDQKSVAGSGVRITGTAGANCLNITISGNDISDNQVVPTQDYGVRETTYVDYNIISDNIIRGNTVSGVVKTGTYTIVRDNVGWVTSNKGTATISATTFVVFAHGLSAGPALVLASFSLASYGNYTWTTTATEITVTVSTSGTYTVYWYAEV